MAQGVISDNWSLQDISHLFLYGMDDSNADEIVIQDGSHAYKPIPYASIQTEALFDFLTDIVLRDEILVEERFEEAWKESDSPILKTTECGVVRSYPFLNEPDKLLQPRERVIKYMSSTESLIHAHTENVESWESNQRPKHQLLSQTMWGGAGMCARSYVYEKSYTPHPLRKRFFINSGFMLPAGDALHQLISFLNDEQVKVSKKLYGSDSLYSLYINLPSIPIRVIQESSDLSQIIDVALEMRNDFQKLRDWLKSFQNALTQDNLDTIVEFRKEFDSVSQYVNSRIGDGATKKPVTMEAGIGIFKLAMQFDPINALQNQFGIRATLNKLIFGSNGRAEIKKYIKMFDQQSTSIGYEIERHFTRS